MVDLLLYTEIGHGILSRKILGYVVDGPESDVVIVTTLDTPGDI